MKISLIEVGKFRLTRVSNGMATTIRDGPDGFSESQKQGYMFIIIHGKRIVRCKLTCQGRIRDNRANQKYTQRTRHRKYTYTNLVINLWGSVLYKLEQLMVQRISRGQTICGSVVVESARWGLEVHV